MTTTSPPPYTGVVAPLADLADYEMFFGPVDTADQPMVDFLLLVATSVVAQVAPGLISWATGVPPYQADGVTPYAVPEPAVLVTCQTANTIVTDPTGRQGKVQMERVGLVQAQFAPGGDIESLLPVAWRRLLKPWRAPEIASVPLSVPHPMEYGMGGWGWTWWFPTLEGDTPPDPPYYDGWGENTTEWPWSTYNESAPATSGFSAGFDEGF
jgi:hypothetical protein